MGDQEGSLTSSEDSVDDNGPNREKRSTTRNVER